jgi:hypothetical protein
MYCFGTMICSMQPPLSMLNLNCHFRHCSKFNLIIVYMNLNKLIISFLYSGVFGVFACLLEKHEDVIAPLVHLFPTTIITCFWVY